MYVMRNIFINFCLCVLLVAGDCPDKTFKCPSGESFTVGSCWSWKQLQCILCRDIKIDIRRKCPLYSCSGSIDRWFNRDDGCSAPGIEKAFTSVFGSACTMHDLCYAIRRDANDATWHDKCDDEFLHNMNNVCTLPGVSYIPSIQMTCQSARGIAYLAVQNHGHVFPDFAATCRRRTTGKKNRRAKKKNKKLS